MELINITRVVARPIDHAVFNFPETPRKGQSPKNIANTKLLIKKALIGLTPLQLGSLRIIISGIILFIAGFSRAVLALPFASVEQP